MLNTYIILVDFKALTDPYFTGLANPKHEPISQPISKLEFEFERRKLGRDDVRELIYREVLLVSSIVMIMVFCLLIVMMHLFRFWSTTLRCCSSFFVVRIRQILCIQGLCALFSCSSWMPIKLSLKTIYGYASFGQPLLLESRTTQQRT